MREHNGEMVEQWDGSSWQRMPLYDARLRQNAFGTSRKIRRIEGSFDGGMTWKTLYKDQVQLLKDDMIQWRSVATTSVEEARR